MIGDTPFENTARVLRVRGLGRIEQKVLSHLTDAVLVDKGSGRVTWPEWTLPELCEVAGYGISSVQRALKTLEARHLVRRVVRPGRSYVFQPLVGQLPLSITEAAVQPPLPDLPSSPPTQELVASPAPAVRGARGRFVVAEVFHNPGTQYRTPVENSDGAALDFERFCVDTDRSVDGDESLSPVQGTGHPGTGYRTPRYSVPGFDGTIGSTNNKHKQRKESARTESAAPDGAGLRLTGLALTPEQRRALSRQPSEDGNLRVLIALALHIGRDRVEARRWLAVPIAEEGDLYAATKAAAKDTPAFRYDLHSPTGERIIQEACGVAWKVLCREGRFRFTTQEWRDEHARRHRRSGTR